MRIPFQVRLLPVSSLPEPGWAMPGLTTRAPERRELAKSELGLGRHIYHGATCEPAAQLRDARDPPGDQRLGGRRAGDPETRRPALTSTVEQGSGPRLRLLWPGPGIAPDVAFAGRSWLARTLSSGRAVASQAGGRRWAPPSLGGAGVAAAQRPPALRASCAGHARRRRLPDFSAVGTRSGCASRQGHKGEILQVLAAPASRSPKVLSSLRSPTVATSFPIISRDSSLSVTCKGGKDGL